MSDLVPKRRRRAKRRIYELGEFKMIGFSMANALAGEPSVPVLTRAALLSDDPFFHHCMRAFAQEVDARLRERKIAANLSQASNFAIVVDPDASARLYFDCIEYSLEMVAKRAVEKGEAVWSNDIGDIYRGNLRHPKLRPDQHYVLCLRHDWKFLLIFDLTPEQQTDPDALEVTIGLGMRRLLFEQLYETMADENVLATMIARGWFPFNELIGAEFDDLRRAIANDFNLEAVEEMLVSQFTRERCELLLGRWWRSPLYDSRRALLTEGMSLFAEGRYISSIKTLLTEIEGILRERHVPRTTGRQGMNKVLSVAFEEVLDFAGSDTIYFPEQFVRYLRESVFAHFDPAQPATEANRNTVGHGLAPGDTYTAVRALQTVLVLDQINRYVALPKRPPKRRISR